MHQEVQLSQDGRITLYPDYNIRVSSQPNIYGEKFVLRLMKKEQTISGLEELGYPDEETVMETCFNKRNCIAVIAAPTGEGKTTTLYSALSLLNKPEVNITTVEDPVEIRIPGLNQIEINKRVSFADSLRTILRQDPDIILVGEMRDLDTIRLALTAAETGHLVFGTLHTSSASQTVDRIIDVFPEGQQQQIRVQLGGTLEAVFSQTLLPKTVNGVKKGRVMAQEILVKNNAVSNMIREGKSAQLYSAIQTGAGQGMQTLETALSELYKHKLITEEDALAKSQRPEEFRRLAGIN